MILLLRTPPTLPTSPPMHSSSFQVFKNSWPWLAVGPVLCDGQHQDVKRHEERFATRLCGSQGLLCHRKCHHRINCQGECRPERGNNELLALIGIYNPSENKKRTPYGAWRHFNSLICVSKVPSPYTKPTRLIF